MKLLKLTLQNFQGLKDISLDFGGNDASIYGDNATGKTTVFNSITWLLFSKSSTGSKGYTPKTKGPDGDLHNLEHTVEGVFRLQEGRILTLKKIYKEVYKKKRGSNVEIFDTHTNEYFVDGVPSSEKEYTRAIENHFADAGKMKILTMPCYFSEELGWEDRRSVLLDICGDITDAEILASTEEFSELQSMLLIPGTQDQYYTVDDYKKIACEKKKAIGNEMRAIPERIDEANKACPDIGSLNPEELSKSEAEISSLIQRKTDERRLVGEGDAATVMLRKKAEKQSEIANAKQKYLENCNKEDSEVYKSIDELRGRQELTREFLLKSKRSLAEKQAELEDIMTKRAKLISKIEVVQIRTWDGDEVCPTCKRALPPEDVNKAKKLFEQSKLETIAKLNEQGRLECNKDMIAGLESDIAGLKAEIAEFTKDLEQIEAQIALATDKLKTPPPFENTKVYKLLVEELSRIDGENITISEKIQTIDTEIAGLKTKLTKVAELKLQFAVYRQQQERIKELSKREKELSEQYEQIEKGIFLCDEFVKVKVSMITDRINNNFKTVRFRLFVEQLNGGIKEDCEVMIPGEGGKMVPFAFANNAARINAGLEIIDTLSKHWRVSMPVFIDNAESITRIADTETQVIRLVVSEQDKKLRLEIDN